MLEDSASDSDSGVRTHARNPLSRDVQNAPARSLRRPRCLFPHPHLCRCHPKGSHHQNRARGSRQRSRSRRLFAWQSVRVSEREGREGRQVSAGHAVWRLKNARRLGRDRGVHTHASRGGGGAEHLFLRWDGHWKHGLARESRLKSLGNSDTPPIAMRARAFEQCARRPAGRANIRTWCLVNGGIALIGFAIFLASSGRLGSERNTFHHAIWHDTAVKVVNNNTFVLILS